MWLGEANAWLLKSIEVSGDSRACRISSACVGLVKPWKGIRDASRQVCARGADGGERMARSAGLLAHSPASACPVLRHLAGQAAEG